MGSSRAEETAELSPPKSGAHAHMCPGACWGASSRPEGCVYRVCQHGYLILKRCGQVENVPSTWMVSASASLLRLSSVAKVIILSTPTSSSVSKNCVPLKVCVDSPSKCTSARDCGNWEMSFFRRLYRDDFTPTKVGNCAAISSV